MVTTQQQMASKRLSPFHHKQASLGAKFTQDEFGWARAEQFAGPANEKEASWRAVGIADLSHLTKFNLNGRGLTEIISRHYRQTKSDARGQVLFNGSGLFNGVLCAVFSADEAVVIFNESLKEQVPKELTADKPVNFTLVDVSSVLAGCSVLGPNGRALLRKVTELNVNAEDFPNLSATLAPIRHVPTIILRNDIGTLLGYELYFERAYAEFVWDVVFAAGKELGAVPVGSSAMKLLGLGVR
jgi:glycine cleavage system aminomethyltransferase T